MKVICNKAGECTIVSCRDHEEHEHAVFCDCECELITGAHCVPVEERKPKAKHKRVRAYKEDYINENALLKMRVHQLECDLKKFTAMPTMRRITWACKGGAL